MYARMNFKRRLDMKYVAFFLFIGSFGVIYLGAIQKSPLWGIALYGLACLVGYVAHKVGQAA